MTSARAGMEANQVAPGHYARKQVLCRDRLISWSHRSRFRLALDLVEELHPQRLLDYGCGDATLLAELMQQPWAPPQAVGAEIEASLLADCRARLSRFPGLNFVSTADLLPQYKAEFDLIFCLEVLEHVVDPLSLLAALRQLLAPAGTLVISVPVETGLPVMVKQTVRRIAGWRGLGDYPGTTPYTWPELLQAVFSGSRPRIRRPVYKTPDGRAFHDHKGFNWMQLRRLLQDHFVLRQTLASPVGWLTPHLASQCWFVLQSRSEVRAVQW